MVYAGLLAGASGIKSIQCRRGHQCSEIGVCSAGRLALGFAFGIEKIQMYSVLNTTYAIPVVGALGLSFAKFFSKFGGVFKK